MAGSTRMPWPSDGASRAPPAAPSQGKAGGAEARPRPYKMVLSRLRSLTAAGFRFLFWFVLVTWSALAIHYSNLPWPWFRTTLATAFAAFAIWALCLSHRRRMPALVVALFLGVL